MSTNSILRTLKNNDSKNFTQEIIIRQETPRDYQEVYDLVMAAFATADFSDGTEADYLNDIRTKDTFIPELSLVAQTSSNKLVGQIVLYRTLIQTENGDVETLVLSPISVHPDYFRQGIARAMVERASQLAAGMGFTSIFLCGDPIVYRRLGFVPSYSFGIQHIKDPKAEWCMGLKLVPHALSDIFGTINIV